ncbi:sugar transferase [Streptomyces sp. NPDC048419]|uniref:sugar transferase n=1 Tax=Streptomyces sp. NPDC048419 TaxID=3365547 RepID=UPI00371571F3
MNLPRRVLAGLLGVPVQTGYSPPEPQPAPAPAPAPVLVSVGVGGESREAFDRTEAPDTDVTHPKKDHKRWIYRIGVVYADWAGMAIPGIILKRPDQPYAGLLSVAWILVRLTRRRYFFQTAGEDNRFGSMLIDGLILTALVSLASALFRLDISVDSIVIPLWSGVLLSYAADVILQRQRQRRWAQGRDRSTTLLVGPARGIADMASALRRGGEHELQVGGVCLSDPENAAEIHRLGLPFLGGVDRVNDVIRALGISTMVVLPNPKLDAAALRRMTWTAAAQGVDLLLAPALANVPASRLELRTTNGVALVRVRAPNVSRFSRLPKEMLDRFLATCLLLLLSPPMLLIALIVRLDSFGPALFRQRRVGRYGDHFTMLKFRTTRVNSEALRAELADHNESSDGWLFKLKKDPRITRVGSFLRRSSLDELPQLINVVKGNMSLVGPRPALPEEVERYTPDAKRRLLVKPGLTGLWQVSGRSDLPWDEAIRLDLYYVDNWSMALDLSILLRTGSAVVRGTGAY